MSEYSPVHYEIAVMDTRDELFDKGTSYHYLQVEAKTVHHDKLMAVDWMLWDIDFNTRKALEDE